MKKLILLITTVFALVQTNAQLTTVLNVQANPSAIVSSWASTPQTITLVVNNTSQTQRSFKIKATIKTTSGDVVATSDVTKVATFTSVGGTSNVYNAITAMPYEYLLFSGKYNSTMQRSGKLPTESYQLCTQLVNPIDYTALTQEQCKVFNIASLQLPFLVSPAAETSLEKNIAQSVITFRWTPLVPRPAQADVTYKVQVFEVLDGQKPMQAFRANMPLLDVDVKRATQYIWRPLLSFDENTKDSIHMDSTKPDVLKTFIWTVQTLTNNLTGAIEPLTEASINGDGRSQPQVFYISNNATASKLKQDKITFPPNAVANNVLDKITFPPNCLAIFCPNGTIALDGKCVTIDIPLQANAKISDGMLDGKKQLLSIDELQKRLQYAQSKKAKYIGSAIKTIEDKQYLIAAYNNNKNLETVVVPLINENGFLKMTTTATIVTESDGKKLTFTKDEPVKKKRKQASSSEHHYVGHVTLLR
jgi:hypothetical protein